MNRLPNWTEDELDDAWEEFLAGDRCGPFPATDPRSAILTVHEAGNVPDPNPAFVAQTRAAVTRPAERRGTSRGSSTTQLGVVYVPKTHLSPVSLVRFAVAIALALFLIGMLSFGSVLFQESNGHSAIASAIATRTSNPTPIPTFAGSTAATE
jgi:hypothetical protein